MIWQFEVIKDRIYGEHCRQHSDIRQPKQNARGRHLNLQQYTHDQICGAVEALNSDLAENNKKSPNAIK